MASKETGVYELHGIHERAFSKWLQSLCFCNPLAFISRKTFLEASLSFHAKHIWKFVEILSVQQYFYIYSLWNLQVESSISRDLLDLLNPQCLNWSTTKTHLKLNFYLKTSYDQIFDSGWVFHKQKYFLLFQQLVRLRKFIGLLYKIAGNNLDYHWKILRTIYNS